MVQDDFPIPIHNNEAYQLPPICSFNILNMPSVTSILVIFYW